MATATTPLIELNNGVELPALGLGVFQSPPAETVGAVEAAIANGYRLIDTAAAYMNEREVGEGIRRSGIERGAMFVTTKLWISDYGYEPAPRVRRLPAAARLRLRRPLPAAPPCAERLRRHGRRVQGGRTDAGGRTRPCHRRLVFQRVGGFNFLVDIDSAAGASGKTLVDNRAFFSTIRLNGVLSKKLGGLPLEYAFLITEVDAAGVAIGATTQVTPAQIARTRIGSLSIYAPTGPGDPNPIKLKDYTVNGTAGPNEVVASFTADGWIKVPQESDVFSGGFFTPSGDMINLITSSIASWPPIEMTGKQAGQSAGPPFAQNKYFKIEMRIRPQGGAASSGGVLPQLAIENTRYNNITHHPSWNPSTESNALGVAMLDIQQLMGPGAGCTEITTDLDVLVTAAHPNLGPVTVEMDGPSGTLEFIEPAPTPNEVVGTAAIPTAPTSPPPPVWDVASLPPCAYVVRLSVTLLLTSGDSVPLPLTDQMAFCKA